MRASKEQIQQEALTRAASGQSFANWPAIIAGFTAKGIAESDIRPRENLFTYQAWRALGRQVRRGEHGVKVVTFVSTDRGDAAPADGETTEADATPNKRKLSGRRPWTATVFHISQTDPIQPERMPIGHAATAACANSGM
jgi:hypothetical protein